MPTFLSPDDIPWILARGHLTETPSPKYMQSFTRLVGSVINNSNSIRKTPFEYPERMDRVTEAMDSHTKRSRTDLIVVLSYILLTLIATYPVWLSISQTVIGPEEDNQQNCWTVWWYHKALFEDHVSPWRCHLMFYPFGASLGLHDVGPAYAFPGALLAQMVGAIASYNTLILLSFVASAFAAYLLVRDMGFRSASAWTAGVVFAFSPFLTVHAQHHLQLTGIHWFPLLALALRRTRADTQWKWPILSGLFFAMAALSSLYFAVFALLLSLCFVVWHCYVDRRVLSKLLPRIAVFGLVPTILLVPRAIVALDAMKEGGEYLLFGASEYCSDLLGLVLPPSTHPLWGDVFESAQLSTTGSPWEFEYLGFFALLTALYGLRPPNRGSVVRWLVLAAGSVILSFGPLLHVSGKVITGRLLPYHWLIQNVPILDGIRVPVRFTLLGSLGIAIAAGRGSQEMARRLKTPIAAVIVGGLVFVDFMQAPLQTIPRPNAPAHQAILEVRSSCALLDIPVDEYFTRLKSQYLQMEHGSATVSGALGRDPGHTFALMDSLPTLQEAFMTDAVQPSTEISEVAARQELRWLSRRGIGGVIFHRHRLPAATEEERQGRLLSLLGVPLYTDSLYIGWALQNES